MKLTALILASSLMLVVSAVYAERSDGGYGRGESSMDRGGVKKGTFTDSSGTGWNYCSGKCSKRVEKDARTDGVHKIIRITKGSCKCSCVLFKNAGGKLVRKLVVTGKSGYLDIGQGNPGNYSVRCCTKD